MPCFRGFFALNGAEIANSARLRGHLGASVPTTDVGVLSAAHQDCGLTLVQPGFYELPATSHPVTEHLYSPPDGARRYGKGLLEIDDECWSLETQCGDCRSILGYDDTWPGLGAFLSDTVYRPELAPWYSTRSPESAEFAGVMVVAVDGFGPTPVERAITEMVGHGGSAGPSRDHSRTLHFEAVLVGCTNAGLEYGMNWLACRLRETTQSPNGGTLQFLSAHPEQSAADPLSLAREFHGVMLTQSPTVMESVASGRGPHRQASMYRVSWEMVATVPYAYAPPFYLGVEWDEVQSKPVNWVHAADCVKPETCVEMPVLFSAECEPEEIEVVTSPPPSCGGCMPVCGVSQYVYTVPTLDYPLRCQETTASLTITNTSPEPLTLQAYWRVCGTDVRCEDERHPVQISGLPVNASITLDSITGRYWAVYEGRMRRPVGIVSTPNGAPWRAAVIDRQQCWQFVIRAAASADFEVSMTLTDREP